MKSRFTIQTTAYQLLHEGFDKVIRAVGYKQSGQGYQDAIKEFICSLEDKGIDQIKQIKPIDMIAYYECLTARANTRYAGVLSNSSIARHLYALRLFFDYLLEERIIERDIILPKIRIQNGNHRNILSTEEIQQLYSVCETMRDKAIVHLAYACGARRNEMRHLQVAEVQLNMGIVIIKEGKNDKRREIPITNSVIDDLKDYLINERHTYLKGEDNQRTEAFLVNNNGKEMKGDHMNERLKELILKTGNHTMIGKGITLHCLRHSISTHLLDNGADMNFVKDFLGHAEIDTVQVYTRRRKVQQQRLKQMMR